MCRFLHLDLVRIFACVMIVLMHSPMPEVGCPGFVLVGISYLSAPSIGLFFMVSGALLLKRYDLADFRITDFLRRRLSKVLWPTVFWFVIGNVMGWMGLTKDELGILWFMYSLIGLYLLSPILIRWINMASKREIEFYLLLWAISLCYPLLNLYFDFRENVASWVYYFHGYVGYFVLGSYLKLFGLTPKIRKFVYALLVLCSFALPLCNYLLGWNWPMIPTFWFRSISVALVCIFWWELMQKLSPRFENKSSMVSHLSKLTFGIYLVHIILMRCVLWQFEWMQSMPGVIQPFVCAVLTFLLSYFCCWGLSKFKISKYIIGV